MRSRYKGNIFKLHDLQVKNYLNAIWKKRLHAAVCLSYEEGVKLILTLNMDTAIITQGYVDKEKNTILHAASELDNPPVLKQLLDFGADRTATNALGLTPMEW